MNRNSSAIILALVTFFVFVGAAMAQSTSTSTGGSAPSGRKAAIQKVGKDAALTFEAAGFFLDNLPDQPYATSKAHQERFGANSATASTTRSSASKSTGGTSRSTSSSSLFEEHIHFYADIGYDCKLVPAGTATVTVDPGDGSPSIEVDCRDPDAGLVDQSAKKRKGPFCSCLKTPSQYCKDERKRIDTVLLPQVYPQQCYKCTSFCNIVSPLTIPGGCG